MITQPRTHAHGIINTENDLSFMHASVFRRLAAYDVPRSAFTSTDLCLLQDVHKCDRRYRSQCTRVTCSTDYANPSVATFTPDGNHGRYRTYVHIQKRDSFFKGAGITPAACHKCVLWAHNREASQVEVQTPVTRIHIHICR